MDDKRAEPSGPAELYNWNRSAVSRPAVVATPRSVADVVAIVRDPARYPSPVRAVGKRHSTTACIEADGGTLILTHHLKTIALEAGGARITVGAGATMLEVRDALRGADPPRELAVSPEIGNATAGSVACSGSKDSSLDGAPPRAQIASCVVALKLVNARGQVVTVDESGATVDGGGRPDPDLTLELVRGCYGLCGIVVEVTFETAERTLLHNRFHWLPFEAGRVPTIDDVFGRDDGHGRADAVLGFLQPYYAHGGLLVERRRRVADPGKTVIGPEDLIRRATRDWIWEWGASGVTSFLAGAADARRRSGGGMPADDKGAERQHGVRQMARAGAEIATAAIDVGPLLKNRAPTKELRDAAARVVAHSVLAGMDWPDPERTSVADDAAFARLLRLFDRGTGVFLSEMLGGYHAYRSDSLVEFTDDRDTFFDFTFWAFPQREWDRLVPAYLRFCRAHLEFRPALFTEVYFICQDTSSWLSFSADGPVFTLDIVDNRPGDEGWKKMNHEYNRWAADQGGRPLMNQTKELHAPPGLLRRAYGEAWTRFSRAVWASNPPLAGHANGRFVSDYFNRLLDPRPA